MNASDIIFPVGRRTVSPARLAWWSALLGFALVVGFAAGIIVFIPFYFAARTKPIGRCLAVLIACVVGELAVATPINNRIAFVGSFVAFAVGLLVVSLFRPMPPAGNAAASDVSANRRK